MQWAGVIVPIAVIAVLAIIVLIVFLYIRARLKNFSRQAFGTDDLGKAVNQIQNASEQPRTVHGMTDIYLPAIQRDFPEFDYEVFKSRAQGVLRSYFAAISAKDMGLLNDDCSVSLRNDVYSIIGDLESHGYDRQISEGTFHQTEIARYIKNGATVSIVFNISVGRRSDSTAPTAARRSGTSVRSSATTAARALSRSTPVHGVLRASKRSAPTRVLIDDAFFTKNIAF